MGMLTEGLYIVDELYFVNENNSGHNLQWASTSLSLLPEKAT